MKRYIAFLRAINVGGHVVKMEQLRGLFEDMNLTKVETFIASGNVIFDSATRSATALETTIESRLQKALGYEVATFIRTTADVAAVDAYQAFSSSALSTEGATLYIGFLKDALSRSEQERVLSFKTAVDDFHVDGREIYWLCRIRSSESEFSLAKLEKALGKQATFRKSTTVHKMAEMYSCQVPKTPRRER